jgi:hypothetical protein
MNMILGEVEETLTTVEIDDETYEEIIKVRAPPGSVGCLPAWQAGGLGRRSGSPACLAGGT